jgi:glutaryl-CoA dehydrogenase
MASTAAAPPAISPKDFLDIDRLLSDEERDIRDTVRAFVATACCRTSVTGSRRPGFPASWRRARQARRARHAPGGLRLRGRERDRLRPGLHGARGRRQRHAQPRLGPGLAGDVRDLALGLAGSRSRSGCRDGGRRGDRLLRADRARRRLRPRVDAHAGAPRRHRLDPARPEDVDHQRLDRRRRRRLGATDEGVRGFLVPARHQAGFTTQDIHRKLSLRASVTSELLLDDVRLPADASCPRPPRCAARSRA